MKLKKSLYFLAIVPPHPIRNDIFQMKQECAKEFSTKAALRSPPHITLHMPFQMNEDKIDELVRVLLMEISSRSKFLVSLKNYGAFSPSVIYVQVEPNEELSNLHAHIRNLMRYKFNILNQDYKDRGFHPHITIAFRDLRKAEFKRAWNKYSIENYSQEFVCESICLLKHTGKEWNIFEELQFSN